MKRQYMKEKHMILIIAVNLLISLMISSISWSQEEYRDVTVTGIADIVRGDEDLAKKSAIRDALRNAVEMAVGVIIKSSTEVEDFTVIKDEIKSNAEGYVKEYDILKEGVRSGRYNVTLRAKVMTEKISEAFKKRLNKARKAIGNPSVTFVLTTWKKIGGDSSYTKSWESGSSKSSSNNRLSESEWKKVPDMTIIDSFSQEFKEKGFDLKATDKARRIALVASLIGSSIDVFDRESVRKEAEKEGANYVARGEVQIIDYQISESTGKPVVTTKVGVEIIDVNSADIVGAYSNTTKAAGSSRDEAEAQAIKTIAVLAARTLANQTMETWEQRASVGQFYTIEVRNITNMRKQQRPLLKVIESVAQIRQHTNPTNNILLVEVSFKGPKNALGEAIVEKLEKERVPGFSSDEFDGPKIEGGNVVFIFTR